MGQLPAVVAQHEARARLGQHAGPDHAAFPCLDGLRALAAFAVFVRHSNLFFFLQDSHYASVEVTHWLDRLGFFGVSIFFVLSGFLLYRPYALAILRGGPPPRLFAFWKRRVCRIFPAYWLVLTVSVFLLDQDKFVSFGQGFNTYTLTHSYRSGFTRVGLGVAWTLVIEVSFYATLPLFAMLVRAIANRSGSVRGKVRSQLVCVAVFGAAAIAFRYGYVGHHAVPARSGTWFSIQLAPRWLPSYLDWFALGMAMAIGTAWISIGESIPRVFAWLGRRPGVAWLSALVGYAVVVRFVPYTTDSQLDSRAVLIRWVVTGLAAAAVVLPGVFGDQQAGPIRWVLRTRVLAACGVVSYGIYLWHLPVWIQLTEWFPAGTPMLVQMVVVFAVTVALAATSCLLLERPIVRWAASGSRPAPRRTATP